MNRFPTPKENIVLDMLFEWLGESRCNRTMDEYIAIASRVPKTAAVHAYVNERLCKMGEIGFAPYQICYFKAKDRHPWYASFPKSLSIETVRSALKKSGLLELRALAKLSD